jgi:hypothetical protein
LLFIDAIDKKMNCQKVNNLAKRQLRFNIVL